MQKNNSDLLLKTIDGIYEWANSRRGRNGALDATASFLGGCKAVLLQLSLVGRNDFVIAESGLGENTARKLMESRDAAGNFLLHCRGWDEDNVYDASRLQLSEELSSTEFLQQVLVPNDLNYSIAGVITRKSSSCIVLCCYRGFDEPAFHADELRSLGSILPHWRRAISLKNRLDQMNLHSQATHRILDHAPFSILLVDSAAYVLYQNFMATIGNKAEDGLVVRDNRLHFISPEARKEFMCLLDSADKARNLEVAASPIMMAVERPSGSKPYQLMILPVQSAEEAGLAIGPTYALFIYDPMVNLPVDVNSLCALEGLTHAEARLCESLYNTKNLGETAVQLEVSMSTAKTHLLNTFRKLEINSQSELMKYLAHMPKISNELKH